ncbi:MAG: RNA-binding cell elongation regulator Jag/EloR [Actinomycetota bacterium]
MEWVKTTAKTLPEAIDLALDNLGVDESEAEIVVLEEPKQGLFGRMRGTARVEARVKPKPIRPKNDRNRNRRKSEDGRGGDRNRNRNRNRKRQGGERSGGNDRGGQSADQRSNAGGRGDNSGGRSNEGGRSRQRDGERGGGRGGSNDGGRRRGNQRDGSRQKSSNGAGRSANDDRGRQRSNGGGEAKASGEVSQGAAVEDVATHLRTFLTDLTEAFGLDGGVTIDDSEEGTLVGQIEGRHGLLVGPKGRTLDAVQELARISCQRSTPSSIRIKVDVGGYREQRAAALGDFAAKAADRAVADGDEVALEPMSPADRKSVHDALNGDARVETRSVGSEPRRRVVVVPLDVDDADEADEDDGLTEVEDLNGSGSGEEE